MGKFLLLLFVVLVGYLLVKGLKAPARRRDPAEKRADVPAERMVACAHCGVNLPESESLPGGGRHFCSEEHRRLGSKA